MKVSVRHPVPEDLGSSRRSPAAERADAAVRHDRWRSDVDNGRPALRATGRADRGSRAPTITAAAQNISLRFRLTQTAQIVKL